MKIIAGYPDAADEKTMVERILTGNTGAQLSVEAVNTVLKAGEFIELRDQASRLRVDPAVLDYAVRLTAATRQNPLIEAGAGPRGSLALIRCARSRALMQGRDFVIPDDIKALAKPVLAHRVMCSAESELEGLNDERIIAGIVERTEAPRT
jgi:MoxR-like ATPase